MIQGNANSVQRLTQGTQDSQVGEQLLKSLSSTAQADQELPDVLFSVMGLDPGKTTGFAIAQVNLTKKNYKWVEVGEVPIQEFSPWLSNHKYLSWITVEDFTLRPGKKTEFLNQGWTNLETAKLVGRVEQFCFENVIKCRVPQPAEKPFGYKLAGIPYVPGKKGTHKWDAMAHCCNLIRRVWKI